LELSKEIQENKILKKNFEAKELKIEELNKLIERKNVELQEKDNLIDKVVVYNSNYFFNNFIHFIFQGTK
jgi:hypothetical protein